MVEAGVSKKLLALVEKNNKPSGDIRLQHALLSALRYAALTHIIIISSCFSLLNNFYR
jgi:hypothetical protein